MQMVPNRVKYHKQKIKTHIYIYLLLHIQSVKKDENICSIFCEDHISKQ